MCRNPSFREVSAAALILVLAACGDGTGPAPTVVELEPADGATGVTVHTSVAAVFSEPVSIRDPASALLLDRDGRPVTGAVSVSGSTVFFRPDRALDPGTEYTATLSSEMEGATGTLPGRDGAWAFTTTGAPPPVLDTAAIMPHVRALAHDSMNGRGSGTDDELRAALYIRDRFAESGLDPGIPDWLQPFDIPDEPGGLTGATSQNVLAVLPGHGALAAQWVVVGAHYDHVGVQEVVPDSLAIFNGADDNASGTALMLAVADALVDYVDAGGTGDEPRRSIMFQAYGAEELGLVGSRHYCAEPVEPMADVLGMVNFDMVGRLRFDEVHVSGLWTSREWTPVLEDHADGLVVRDKLDCQSCSDYACFRHAGRPAIWLFTGLHDEYHSPDDDAWLIDPVGLARVGGLAAGAIVHLALRSQPLPFGGVVPELETRRRATVPGFTRGRGP